MDPRNIVLVKRIMEMPQQMIALSLLAYVVGVWIGEAIRDMVYGKVSVT